jgi:hypothetical protein
MDHAIEAIVVFIIIALGIFFLVHIMAWDGQRNV